MGKRRRNYTCFKVSSVSVSKNEALTKTGMSIEGTDLVGEEKSMSLVLNMLNFVCEWHIKMEISSWKISNVFMSQRLAMFELFWRNGYQVFCSQYSFARFKIIEVSKEDLSFFLKIKFIGMTLVHKIYRSQVYNSLIHDYTWPPLLLPPSFPLVTTILLSVPIFSCLFVCFVF